MGKVHQLLILCTLGLLLATRLTSAEPLRLLDVTRPDASYGIEGLRANDPFAAATNTARIQALMELAPAGAAIHFPAGDYYFLSAALPNHGTVETTQPGQVLYGDGPGVSNLIQCDARKDFGFVCDSSRKRVPTATVRIRDKGCRLRDLSVLADPALPAFTVLGSVAIQIANLRYLPDGNVGIVETTGLGSRYLVDFVNVEHVDVGRNLDAGVQSARFFEVGVDIVGSGGEVRVRDMDRLDALIGVRLDNGNHCGQGGYYFDDLELIGRHGLNAGSVFFDWVGGQAPFIRNCNSGFVSGLHAGPLGAAGDRLEPVPEGAVIRRAGKDWDWLTWHDHLVVDDPSPAQRTEWYGLPRHAEVVRIASEPRTGGTVWTEGEDFTTELIEVPGDLQYATRIHWKTRRPTDGSVYYAEFHQPLEYRVHDLEWGQLVGCQLGEALQSGPDGYAIKFEDQGYGYLNPDFGFAVGYGFLITQNMILNGSFLFEGRVDYMRIESNTTGVCDFKVKGLSLQRQATRLSFFRNQTNSVLVGDFVSGIRVESNDLLGRLEVDAPIFADLLTVVGNTVTSAAPVAIALHGKLGAVRVMNNEVLASGGDGLGVSGATSGLVWGNTTRGCPGRGVVVEASPGLVTDVSPVP